MIAYDKANTNPPPTTAIVNARPNIALRQFSPNVRSMS